MIRHQFKTRDDVRLNAVEPGKPLGQAILFIHGLSQSWRSWLAQFVDPQLRERFRLVALDLRGHGESRKRLRRDALLTADRRDMLGYKG